ncbi:MAG: polysaccharide pyruvyl transferase CsaB, partial [Leptolyngbya sp. SIO1D8]|nr:polysaccharide pyruvyl transferase CsaB [Leptolyngbya sp. SIO1D8]
CGYYGMGNGGDEALLASLLQMLPAHVEPIVLSGNPLETAQRYGVKAYPRKSLKGIWSALQGSQGFIWGGGSLMQDATSPLNPLYYGGLMLLAQTMGLRTLAWAQGIGPLERVWTQWLTRTVLANCTGVSVRDAASAALTASWQIEAYSAPDPVWALASQPVAELMDSTTPQVAVALRSHPWLTEDRLSQFAEALANFQTVTQTKILLIPFQVSKDLPIAQKIQPYLKGANQILTIREPSQLKGVFRNVEMAIAMRLHALIMAAAEGCRCFALSYDPKVTHVAEDLQVPGWDMSSSQQNSDLKHPVLDNWPETVSEMTQQLLNQYANGPVIAQREIQSRLELALNHQDLLNQLLS